MTELRFKPAYNPYTEPSMEIFAFHKGERFYLLYIQSHYKKYCSHES
jgi:phenylalanyl-tRNA synthetase alpha subunit